MIKEQFLQKHGGADKTATVGAVVEAVDELMMPKMLEAFDQVLLPALGEMLDKQFAEIDKRFSKQENVLKDYIDRKFTDHTAEMIKRLDKRFEQEHKFHEKVIALFKKHNIGDREDIAFLEGLAQ